MGARARSGLSKLLSILLAVALAVTMTGLAPAAPAAAVEDDAVGDVRVGLISLGAAFGGAAALAEISTDLPLTDVSIRDVLSLDTVIGREVNDRLAGKDVSLAELHTLFTDGALVMSEPVQVDGGTEWVLTVDVQDAVAVPLRYSDERMRFGAGAFDGELAGRLQGTIGIRYDPSQLALRTFMVTDESTFTVRVWTRASGAESMDAETLAVPTFPVVDGFVEEQVGGSAASARVDAQATVRLRDPNGRGRITTEDLMFGTAEDLFVLASPIAADAVAMSLPVDTSLLDGRDDGSITVGTRPPDAEGPWPSPVIERSAELDRLTSLTRADAMGALASHAAALLAAEATVDAPLPMLDASLTDLHSPGSRLFDLLGQQAMATITCGAADTDPPTGAPVPGAVRYCQARTDGLNPDQGTDVEWSAADGATIEASPQGSVGSSPTANAVISGGGGFPRLTVTFTADGSERTARSLLNSVQELGETIDSLGLGGAVSYDPDTQALEVGLVQEQPDASIPVSTGGGAALAPVTGLTGLCQAATGVTPRVCGVTGEVSPDLDAPLADARDATVSVTGREVHAALGIALADPTSGAPQQPARPDVYLRPAPDGTVWSIGGLSATVPTDAPMTARIGFLQADVELTDYSLSTTSPAARVTLDTGDLEVTGGTLTGVASMTAVLGGGEADATPFDSERHITALADLSVRDTPDGVPDTTQGNDGQRPIDASGTIRAEWTTLDPSVLPTVSTGGDYDKLRLFDLIPSLRGVAGPGTTATTLVDPGASFLRDFGLQASDTALARTILRTVHDQTTASTCSRVRVDSDTTLVCIEGSLLGSDPAMAPGDEYVIDGEPEALRDVLLEDLATVLNVFATPDESLDTARTFPMVNVRPDEISAARDLLQSTVSALRGIADDDAPSTDVSTIQGFGRELRRSLGTSSYAAFTVTGSSEAPRLELSIDHAVNATSQIPLRVRTGDSQLRILSGGVDDDGQPLDVALPLVTNSTAAFTVAVSLADGSSFVGSDARVTETVGDFSAAAAALAEDLSGKPVEYSGTTFTTADGVTDPTRAAALHLGVRAEMGPRAGSAEWLALADLRGSMEAIRVATGAVDCGTPGGKPAACAWIHLVDSVGAASDVAVSYDANDSSGGAGANLDSQPLKVQFLADALAALPSTLTNALDGDLQDLPLPLLGANLDGAADIPASVASMAGAARAALTQATGQIDESTMTAGALSGALATALGSVDGMSAGPVVLLCKGSNDPCAPDAVVTQVREIRADLTLEGTAAETNGEPAFQVGLAGLPITSDLAVDTQTDWTLTATVGVRRGTGPFLAFAPAQGESTVELLTAHVVADLPTKVEAGQCHDWTRLNGDKGLVAKEQEGVAKALAENAGFVDTSLPITEIDVADGARCLDAVVGYLPSVLVDLGETGLDTTITIDAAPGIGAAGPANSEGLVFLPAIFDEELPTSTTADGSGRLNVYFEGWASELGFFDVVGTIDATWADGDWVGDFQFGHLRIDAATVGKLLDTGYSVARDALAPLNPVIDVLASPLPVVSDLATMVGGSPITLLSILGRLKQDIKLIEAILEFQQLLARLPVPSDEPDLIPLSDGPLGGRFIMANRDYRTTTCQRTVDYRAKGGQLITEAPRPETSLITRTTTTTQTRVGHGSNTRCTEELGSKVKRAWDESGKGTPPPKTDPLDPFNPGTKNGAKMSKSTQKYISLPSISVPILEESKQVYDLLLARGDSTLLRVEFGAIGVTFSQIYSFGPLMLGPVPAIAQIGGDFGIEGRFAFLFDTHGLTERLDALDHPGDVVALSDDVASRSSVFSEGFAIDDLDAQGADVPEMKFVVTIWAGASVSFKIIEAGIAGGVTLDLSLDQYDPNGDGKLRFEEYAGLKPECAVSVSSGLSFFLQFRLRIDLWLTVIEKNWDIVRSPRIKIFDFHCDPVSPVLAVYDEGSRQLRLTMGPRSGQRLAFLTASNEAYTVRQMNAEGTQFQVSAFNLVREYTVAAGTRIVADGGAGKDKVRLLPGQVVTTPDPQEPDVKVIESVAFSASADVSGGDEADVITAADGADSLRGGTGNDTIEGGAGNDAIDGDDGNDAVNAGVGRDTVHGGVGNDTLNGGGGSDIVVGESGDDTLDGGVGADRTALFPTATASEIAPLLDSGDVVIGNAGADVVTGGAGSDIVSGGELAPPDGGYTFTATEELTVDGMLKSGGMLTIPVTIETVDLPSLATVRARCAEPGTATADMDSVSGGDDRDYVLGGGGPDTLSGGGGDDVVCGRGGDDAMFGDGADVVQSLEGDDEMRGGPGADRIYAAGGDDTVFADAGDDLVRGGPGADAIEGGTGADLLLGDAGADGISGDSADAEAGEQGTARRIVCRVESSIIASRVDLTGDLVGEEADDGRLEGLLVTDGLVHGADGAPYTGVIGPVVFTGGKADLDGDGTVDEADDSGMVPLAGLTRATGNGDCILGGDGADAALLGQSGGDYVDGGPGAETVIHGGDGADLVRGGLDSDHVFGDAGDDLVVGDSGDDTLEGNAGDDVLRGGLGADLLVGGSQVADEPDGADELLGDGGADVLAGDNALVSHITEPDDSAIPGASLTLLGTSGDVTGLGDALYGGFGDDWAFGQAGDDLVRGGHDSDVVEGGPGADTVHGDDGADFLIGGSSTDGAVTRDRSGAGLPDGRDDLRGDDGVDGLDGVDVVAGDNARMNPGESATATGATVQLFDVALVGAALPSGAASAADVMTGGAGNDFLFGQGGDDWIAGGDGDDVAEGNAGDDVLSGNGGQDDLVGGGSSRTGAIFGPGASDDRMLMRLTTTLDGSAAGMLDGADTLYGGTPPPIASVAARLLGDEADSHDVLLGDNGRVTRPVSAGALEVLSGGQWSPRLVRTVAMADTTQGPTSGSDALFGGDGDDDLYGQFDSGPAPVTIGEGITVNGDLLGGGPGDDALIGDQGVDVPTPASALGGPAVLSDNARFVTESVLGEGSLVRVVTLTQVGVGGTDVLEGDSGDDALHSGFGADAVDGGSGRDVLFGADGDDALWGGPDHDRIFGGLGHDRIDLKVRAADPALWAAVRPEVDQDGIRATVNDADVTYGGRGADEAQADVGDSGRVPGDRLLDWIGIANLYYVCDSGYGVGQVLRSQSPSVRQLLVDLARTNGAVDPGTVGSSGHVELGLLDGQKDPTEKFANPNGMGSCEAG